MIEVIIVDGHSTDETVKIAEKYPCKIITESVGNQAGAYNAGIGKSEGKFIVFTDADCFVPSNWLKDLLKYFDDFRVASVAGPNLTPEDDSEIAKSAGEVLCFLSKVGARYGLTSNKVMETFHNPTCNVAYRKDVLLEISGFNESLVTCADEELDYRIKEKGYRILYTPEAKVFHYRRTNYNKFAVQSYKYALGRAQSIKLHRRMGRWFHYIPSLAMVLFVSIFATSFYSKVFFNLTLASIAFVFFSILSVSLIFSRKDKTNSISAFVLTIVWLFAYGFGFFKGFLTKTSSLLISQR